MSAFMVGREHIRYLVEAADSRRLCGMHGSMFRWWSKRLGASVTLRPGHATGDPADISRTGLGQLWWDANRESIEARYPDTRADFSNAPGPIGEDFAYHHEPNPPVNIDPAQVIRACDCLEYQSCEYEGWQESEARAALRALRERAIRRLVDEVTEGRRLHWEIPERATA